MASLSFHAKVFHVFFLNISFLLLVLCLIIYTSSSSLGPVFLTSSSAAAPAPEGDCSDLDGRTDHTTKCTYLKVHNPCVSQGYIDYLKVFYCLCGGFKILGFTLLALWLIVLFYLLGNTASQYFCPSLECLSDVLKLSPTIAGVTLLSLGNGAPDVFSSIVSFTASGSSTGASNVGLSSVLGGAFFVSSVVVGAVSICIPVSRTVISVDRFSFVRDVCFLLAALVALIAMLYSGSVSLWEAICFTSLYLVYVLVVSIPHCFRRIFVEEDLRLPLLVEEAISIAGEENIESKKVESPASRRFRWLLKILKMPLYLPRRLTIPMVSEERWSKPFAVASVILAPLLLSALYNSHTTEVYLFGGLVGVVLGILALETTQGSNPPKKFLLPWVVGGFLMSVVWSYILAGELVALLVSLGHILGISPSILGLTVLAWGNSVGDLMTNVAMAINGGQIGAQIAISGCYAGPLFNTLIGLGISLVFAAWSVHPSPFVIPTDTSSFEIVGFFFLWSVVGNFNVDNERDDV